MNRYQIMNLRDSKSYITKVKIIKRLQKKEDKKNKNKNQKKKYFLEIRVSKKVIVKSYYRIVELMYLREMKCGFKENNKR